MTSNNKILTVSYGTFSCTLEGFDDSFDTMKAIAEYFRDLAADDRYFGAEPPQPDADMLAKIAEREVARRVEAEEHEGRILLKAHDDVETPAAQHGSLAAATQQAEDLQPEATEPDAHPDDVKETEATDHLAVDHDVVEADSEATEESAAAFFADSPSVTDVLEENEGSEEITVEAFTNYIPAVAAGEAEAFAEDESLEPEAEEEASAAKAEVETEEEAAETLVGEEPAQSEPEEAFAAPDAEVEQASVEVTDEVVSQDTSDVEDEIAQPAMATDFDGTSGDDAFGTQEVAATEEIVTDEIAGEMEAPDDEPVAEAIAEKAVSEDALGAEAEAEEELILEQEEPAAKALLSGATFADKLQRIRDVVSRRDDEGVEDDFEEISETPTQMGDFAKMPTPQDTIEDEASQSRSATDAAIDIENALASDDDLSEDDAQEDSDDLDRILDRIEAGEFGDLTPEDTDAAPEDNATVEDDNIFGEAKAKDEETSKEEVSVDGRILKVDRAALDAALQSGELEEYEDDTLVGDAELSEEAENDLRRELEEAESFAETREEEKTAARQSLPQIDDSDENDVSRLMAEAEQHMDEPEGKTRRSAFAHLRAAVAARFADRSMEKDDAQAEEEETEAYRSDLAEVVKPRRPGSEHESETRSERSSTARPSPLKLVAEQRIDPKDKADVAPRRVAAAPADELILEEDSGFADYADERGATSLTELLEAAAAYLCHVEHVEQFSRPQLMARVKQADCGEFTREEGLRAFGQLLRTGKIEKVKGGRFVASEAIGFKPGHRQAG